MPRDLPKYLHRERTRHGAVIFYVRRVKGGPRVRIKAEYGSEEFWSQYQSALSGATPTPKTRAGARGTLEWGISLYRHSSAWAALSKATKKQREGIYRDTVSRIGEVPIAAITRDKIIEGREVRAAKPHAANNWLKAMRGFFGWAAGDGRLISTNPTAGVKLLEGKNDADGFHTWTDAELKRFEATYPLGTRERLAFAIFGFTGLRRGDAAKLGPQHVDGDVIRMVTEKTHDEAVIPILPELREAIAAAEASGVTGRTTYIATLAGEPMVKEALGNWFGEACRKAKCPGSAHGLRKALAVRYAEAGASEKQLNAVFGWATGKMANHYTRKAEKSRLAREAGRTLAENKSRTAQFGSGQIEKTRVESRLKMTNGAQERGATKQDKPKS